MSSTAGKIIKCRAAVAWASGKSFSIEEVEVAPPQKNEVRVKIVATGVCQSDISFLNGLIPAYTTFPVILGHEGAGIVESVGDGVTGFKEGDHVIPLYTPQCFQCPGCRNPKSNQCLKLIVKQSQGLMQDGTTRFTCKGQAVHHSMGTSTFSEYTVVNDVALVKINEEAPLETVCLIGCAIGTGYGAALNTAKVEPGSRCAVWGLGGIGLAAVMGCRLAGASKIYGIDINPAKFDMAKKFGCTDVLNPLDFEGKKFADVLTQLTGGGFDYTFECIGNVGVMKDALESANRFYGTTVLIGVPGHGKIMELTPSNIITGRTLKGSLFGGWRGVEDVPKLVDEYMSGKIMVDEFITHKLKLDDINTSLELMRDVASNCSFPSRWEGTWFLSGYQQSVHIRGSQFSYRGKCVASEGNKYLIVNDECHRCLVIYEKHKNVLQFKESECEGDNMYGDQSNPAALAMRSVVKSDHRGGAHPNSNGHPRLSSSDQYIMRSNDDSNDCSFCKRRETLQNLCDQIPGDALLYSLFRENAEPVECPLKGPFSFTYNRGHGECKSPVSNIESCTEESRLLLSFQACPDVQGTESTVEELTCLATWKDGNSRYLIGLVSQHHSHHLPAPHHALSNEERYRCFVYEKISSMMGPMSNMNTKDAKYKLAQSGDATCNGLDSAEVGSRIMTLRKPPPAERCDFPAWFKALRHWRALMGNVGYTFHQSDGSMHITSNGALQTRALCEQINKQTQTEMMAVVHYTSQCDSGFMCMTFYKRDLQVAEIQMGTPASRLEDACAPNHFDLNKTPFVTLLANSPESQMCPLEGLFSLRGAIGPPYITSRHKRNHNNKGHSQHGHHHHEQGHKRHGIQSFRNSEEFGQTSWQSHTRGLSIRSRRAAIAAQPTISGVIQDEQQHEHLESGDSKDPSIVDSYHSKSKVFNLRQLRREQLQQQLQQQQHSQLQPTEGLEILASETIQDVGAEGNDDDSDSDDEHNARRIEINRMDAESSSSFGQQQQRNRRDVPACMVNVKAQRQLLVGCTDPNLIEVRPRCSEDGEESYYCHGSWTENSTVYIIAKNQATQHGVCISYKQLDGNDGLLVVGDTCYRGLQKPPDHHFVANLTLAGKCGDTSSAHSIHRHRTTSRNWIQLTISPVIGGITVFCTMILLNFANS